MKSLTGFTGRVISAWYLCMFVQLSLMIIASSPVTTAFTSHIAVTPKCHRNRISECSLPRNQRRFSSRQTTTGSDSMWLYTNTTLPNFLNDFSHDEVNESLRKFYPLFATECSKFLHLFVCSVTTPLCTPIGVVPPCLELCEKVLNDCQETINSFHLEWPDEIRCGMFPVYQKAPNENTRHKKEEIEIIVEEETNFVAHINKDDQILIQRAASMTWVEALAADGEICIPPVLEDVVTTKVDKYLSDMKSATKSTPTYTSKNHQYGDICPAQLRAPMHVSGYEFLKISNCSSPCNNMYLSPTELDVVRYVVAFIATLSFFVTLFTISTFLIDRHRFQYPERTMVFYAISYFVVSVVFLVGFIMKESIPCNAEIRNPNTNEIIQGFTVVKGGHKRSCTIVFMLLYYFTVSGAIWWLIITFTLLLSAGLKWASESIAKYNVYYHAVAWTVPGIQTLVVVIFGKIEGDNISGVCFVGIHDSVGLRYLVLLPLAIYLFIGVILLVVGFVCLCPVSKSLTSEENKRKHHKYRVRLAIFSLLYVLPQLLLFGVYVIEDKYRNVWEATWFKRSCDNYRVPCPSDASYISKVSIYEYQPHAILFCAKYILILIVALAPLFWIASKKTLHSWKAFLCGSKNSSQKKTFREEQRNSCHNESTMPLTNETLRTIADGSDEKVSDEAAIFNEFVGSKKFGSSASVAVIEASIHSTLSSSSIPSTVSSSNYNFTKRKFLQQDNFVKNSTTITTPGTTSQEKEFKKVFPSKKSSNESNSSRKERLSPLLSTTSALQPPSFPTTQVLLHKPFVSQDQSSSKNTSPNSGMKNGHNIVKLNHKAKKPPPPLLPKPVLTSSILARHNNALSQNSRPVSQLRNGEWGRSNSIRTANSKENVVEV